MLEANEEIKRYHLNLDFCQVFQWMLVKHCLAKQTAALLLQWYMFSGENRGKLHNHN